MNEESIVKVLSTIDKNPEISQRDLSKELGFSLGKTNYILKALVKKGFVKTENFLNSKNKWSYRYILTPEGVKEKIKITKNFIKRKMEEYEKLVKDLEG
jgi:EPS-associated MarR family transcriptional regulator